MPENNPTTHKRRLTRLRDGWARLAFTAKPTPAAQRGALWAACLTVLVLYVLAGQKIASGLGRGVDILVVGIGMLIAFWLLVWLLRAVLRWLQWLPVVVLAGALVFFGLLVAFWGIDFPQLVWLSVAITLIEMLLGGTLNALRQGVWGTATIGKRAWLASVLLVTLAANAALVYWLVDVGSADHLVAADTSRGTPTIAAPNPAEPGPYPVLTLTYGSGQDRWRPEFGEDVDLITQPVFGASYVLFTEKWQADLRAWFLGFDTRSLPLNGRVWYPQGAGPFPLVLMVHGNHQMTDYSDPGYAYLGEHLASHGYIFVSVDENFLNGYMFMPSKHENDGRGWLLLKHLEVWREWQQDGENPLAGKIDLTQIALVGHSRGGEAVVAAAVINRLSHNPDNALTRWNFDFDIRAVAALAPSNTQYQPGGHPLALQDISYLVLQGAHDADVYSYFGSSQYQRVGFSDPAGPQFKAGVYIYQANHSQFNSGWGDQDRSAPLGWFLNRAPLLDAAAQQQIAKVYLTAFLEATLRQNDAYLPLFQDQRTAGDWLPPTLYLNQYQSAGFMPVAIFEEDFDVTTTTLSGGTLAGHGLIRWREKMVRGRRDNILNNHAVYLNWPTYNSADYTVNLPPGLDLSGVEVLTFALADARQEPGEPLDLSVVLVDRRGGRAVLKLSDVLPLPLPFVVQFTRFPAWEQDYYRKAVEPVFQTYRLPLADFVVEGIGFAPDQLAQIIFLFDQAPAGQVVLDDLGFEP